MKRTIIVLLMASWAVAASAAERTKVYQQHFETNPQTSLKLTTEFGRIDIQTWDSAAVDIKVELCVSTRSERRAEDWINSVMVNLHMDGNVVKATVDKVSKERFVVTSFRGDDVKINNVFTVRMPKGMDIEIDHRHGNINFDELTGLVGIRLKYGNLKANRLTRGRTQQLNTLVLAYGRADIGEVGWLSAEVAYSKIGIESAQALALESKYSTVRVGTLGSLACESRYDTYKLGHLDKLTGQSSYTHMALGSLAQHMSMEMRYGELTVNRVMQGFGQLQCEGHYTGIDINFDPQSDFAYELRTRYGAIDTRRLELRSSQHHSSSSSTYMNGRVGHAKAKGAVKLSTEYAHIYLDTI